MIDDCNVDEAMAQKKQESHTIGDKVPRVILCGAATLRLREQVAKADRLLSSQAARRPGGQAARQPGSQAAKQPGSQAAKKAGS